MGHQLAGDEGNFLFGVWLVSISSKRSFRAESLSDMIGCLVDDQPEGEETFEYWWPVEVAGVVRLRSR